jgi:hypothetical protein
MIDKTSAGSILKSSSIDEENRLFALSSFSSSSAIHRQCSRDIHVEYDDHIEHEDIYSASESQV